MVEENKKIYSVKLFTLTGFNELHADDPSIVIKAWGDKALYEYFDLDKVHHLFDMSHIIKISINI